MRCTSWAAIASFVAFVAVALCPRPLAAQTSTSSSPGAVIAKFTGTWKEDASKRTIGSMQNLVFRRNTAGGLEELRGSELRPLVQPVNFGTKPYAIDSSKNTIAWKQVDPAAFERALYSDGQLVTTRRIQLSADGKALTEQAEIVRPGGKTLNTVVYRRAAGDQGLPGRWKPESFKTDTPPVHTYAAVGANGFKFSSTDLDTTYAPMLDGKPVPVVGRAVISNTMVAAKQIDGSTIEITQSREGVATGKLTNTVSADGHVMTVRTISFGPNASKEPSVAVYVKQ